MGKIFNLDIHSWVRFMQFALYIGIAIYNPSWLPPRILYRWWRSFPLLPTAWLLPADWMSAASYLYAASYFLAAMIGFCLLNGWTGGYVLLALFYLHPTFEFRKFKPFPDFVKRDRYYSNKGASKWHKSILCAFISFTTLPGRCAGGNCPSQDNPGSTYRMGVVIRDVYL